MTPTVTPLAAIPFTPSNGARHTKSATEAGWAPLRWTLPEYRRLGELGMFQDVKVMLIKGEIFTMAAPNPPHDEGLSLTMAFLQMAFQTGHFVRNQQGFDIGHDTDPLPDLAVIRGSIRDLHGRMPNTAVMIVEVADTSLFKDTTEKAEWYATAKVPEYWVVDLVNRQLHVFRDPVELPKGLGATAYRKHDVFAETDTVSPQATPSTSIRVAELLP